MRLKKLWSTVLNVNSGSLAGYQSSTKGIVLLTTATAIWGFGFVATRWTLADFSPTWSNAIRFALCCPVVLLYLLHKKSFFRGFKHWRGGAIMGIFLFFGMWTQTVGIANTTVAKAGFYTILYILFTPLISVFYLKYQLNLGFWILVVIALLGIAFLSEFELSQFSFGDAIICLSALFFSLHIVAIALVATPESSAIELNLIPVSYTHLTLPTILRVSISVVSLPFKKKPYKRKQRETPR